MPDDSDITALDDIPVAATAGPSHVTTALSTRLGSTRGRTSRYSISELSALQCGLLVAVLGLVVGLTVHGNNHFNWSYAIIDSMLGFSVGICLSWTKLPALGMGFFFAIGGYWAAMTKDLGLPTLVTLLGGALLGMVAALLLSIPTVSLSFHSFAMLSLIVSQAGYQVLLSVKTFGKEDGIFGVKRGSIAGISIASDRAFFMYCLAVLTIFVVLGRFLYLSPVGRAMRASRDDPIKTASLGANVKLLRMTAFSVGGLVAGTAGVMYAQLQGVVDPAMAYWTASASAVMMVVMGGIGTFYGPLLGGVVYRWIVLEVNAASTEPRFWIGLIFVGVMIVSPGGLAGIAGSAKSVAKRIMRRRASAAPDAVAQESAGAR